MLMRSKQPRSYADIIRHSFTSLLVTIGIVIVLTVSITLVVDQLTRAQNQAAQLSASLQTTQVSNFQDWLKVNQASGLNSHNTFVFIKQPNGTTTSLLPRGAALAAAKTWSIPFTHLTYFKGWGALFRRIP